MDLVLIHLVNESFKRTMQLEVFLLPFVGFLVGQAVNR